MQPCISVVKLSLLLLLYMLRSTFLNALCWQKSQGADRSNYEQRTWPARLSDWWSSHVRDDDSWQQGWHCNRQGRRDDQTATSNCDFIAVKECLYCCVTLEMCISTDMTVCRIRDVHNAYQQIWRDAVVDSVSLHPHQTETNPDWNCCVFIKCHFHFCTQL